VRAVLQRVSEASVRVDGAIVGACGAGLLVLVGIDASDRHERAEALARKIARLRIFESDAGRLDHSVVDVGGEVLVVSQFTLLADTAKGNRPTFTRAAPPDEARPLYEHFCEALRALGVAVHTGVFGARMDDTLVNDGPVTIVLDA
jgi:D-tyrosyl-tRNA(Tyr) deacylase